MTREGKGGREGGREGGRGRGREGGGEGGKVEGGGGGGRKGGSEGGKGEENIRIIMSDTTTTNHTSVPRSTHDHTLWYICIVNMKEDN